MLDMLVALHSQAMAPLQSARLKHFTPVGSRHALTESVHANAAANLRLISSFYHNYFLKMLLSAERVGSRWVGLQTKRDYTLRVWFGQTIF